VLVAAHAAGPVLVLDEPLSFWGGVDPEDGRVIDRHHPQFGRHLAGTVLVLPRGRGSSSASSVVAELIRNRQGPVGFVLAERDPIIALGAIVAAELYPDRVCPVVVAGANYPQITAAVHLEIQVDGLVGW
jgi:predicted aconitase with swiveling domain